MFQIKVLEFEGEEKVRISWALGVGIKVNLGFFRKSNYFNLSI